MVSPSSGGASSSPMGSRKNLKNVKEVKSVSSKTDFDHAEENIFNKVENVEKAVLNAASSLLHDEVDVLFGCDHGASLHPHKPVHTKKDKKVVKNVSMKTTKEVKSKPCKEVKLDLEENDIFNIHREVADFMIE